MAGDDEQLLAPLHQAVNALGEQVLEVPLDVPPDDGQDLELLLLTGGLVADDDAEVDLAALFGARPLGLRVELGDPVLLGQLLVVVRILGVDELPLEVPVGGVLVVFELVDDVLADLQETGHELLGHEDADLHGPLHVLDELLAHRGQGVELVLCEVRAAIHVGGAHVHHDEGDQHEDGKGDGVDAQLGLGLRGHGYLHLRDSRDWTDSNRHAAPTLA